MLIPALTQLCWVQSLLHLVRRKKLPSYYEYFQLGARSLTFRSFLSSCSIYYCNLPFSHASPELRLVHAVNQHVKQQPQHASCFLYCASGKQTSCNHVGSSAQHCGTVQSSHSSSFSKMTKETDKLGQCVTSEEALRVFPNQFPQHDSVEEMLRAAT